MILRPKHLRAIEILAGSDLTLDEAAREVGVSRRTISRWLANGAFRAELVRVRPALSYSFEGLRARTTRLLLMDIVRRLETGGEKLPLKEMTALLAQLMGERSIGGPDGLPGDAQGGEGESAERSYRPFSQLTPEQAEEIWAKVDEVTRRPQDEPPPTEIPEQQKTATP
jgi:transcriptional regulator with XRE-family HTH domain